jgi:uncharacterized phage protein (predicted DNA packaging)
MKWLTLTQIKAQLRIEQDFTLEDDLLTSYGEDAEEMVLNDINRSYTEVIELYGEVPAPLVTASLMLVAASYAHREPVSAQNLYIVGYGYDKRVKPYMKLASGRYEQSNTEGYGTGCKNL